MIVKYYKLEDIKRSTRKAAIYNSLLRYFVQQEVFEDSVLEFLEATAVGIKSNEQLAMRRMEMEMEERRRVRKMEGKQKDRECELELKSWRWKKERKKDREVGKFEEGRKIKS